MMRKELEDLAKNFDNLASGMFSVLSSALEAANVVVVQTSTPEETIEFGTRVYNTLVTEYRKMMFGRDDKKYAHSDIIQ